MNKKGFSLQLVLIVLSVVGSFFYLLLIVLKNKVQHSKLYYEEIQEKNNMENIFKTYVYELSILDGYIKNGIIPDKEYYILNFTENEKLWESKAGREGKSIGGYTIVKITPEVENLIREKEYELVFELKKEITLKNQEGKPILIVIIKLEPFKKTCNLDINGSILKCNNQELNLNKVTITGEIVKSEERDN